MTAQGIAGRGLPREADSGIPAAADRAGERALTLLSTPLNVEILRALSAGPTRLADLRRATGLPAQTTLRGHLANMEEIGVLGKRPTRRVPYAVETEMSPMGHDLLAVADVLERWLGMAPQGPVSLDSSRAKGVIKALVDGWASTILRSIALEPRSLTALDREIPALSYPALERRLSSMRMAGLIEVREGAGPGTPYGVTEWGRRGVVPVLSGSYCEHRHLGEAAPRFTQLDIEAAFLLAMPLVQLREAAGGVCQLEVEPREPGAAQAGVRVEVRDGRVVACDCTLDRSPAAFAQGSLGGWVAAVREGRLSELRFGGGGTIARGLVEGMTAALVSGP